MVAASGFIAYIDVATKGDWSFSISFFTALGLVLAGAALPDIDHPESTLGKRVKFLSHPISMIFGHRGITHSLFMVGCIAFLGVYFEIPQLYWLTVGVLLHFLGDYLTDSGLPLFWPVKRRYRFVLVGSSNSVSEPIMVALVVAASISIIWLV